MSAPHLRQPENGAHSASGSNHRRPFRLFSLTRWFSIEVEVPEPGPAQVLVAMKAVSLNYRDLAVVTGRYPRNTSQPTIIASDGCGEVIAAGDGVTAFQTGRPRGGIVFSEVDRRPIRPRIRRIGSGRRDRRRAHVSFASSIRKDWFAFRNISALQEGATLPCAGLTAWNALVPTSHVQAGDTVLLLGTGGVSIFGLQFAKLHGARVIITSSSDEKLARAKALGADETINYRTHPEWDKEVLRLTGGQGVDIVLEVGGGETFPRSMNSCSRVRPDCRHWRADWRGRHRASWTHRSSDPQRAWNLRRIGGHVRET